MFAKLNLPMNAGQVLLFWNFQAYNFMEQVKLVKSKRKDAHSNEFGPLEWSKESLGAFN